MVSSKEVVHVFSLCHVLLSGGGGTERYFNDVLVYFTSYVIISDILL